MLFSYVWNGASRSCHDTTVLTTARDSDFDFFLPPVDKYYVVDSGIQIKKVFGFLYTSRIRVVRYHMSHFNNSHSPRIK